MCDCYSLAFSFVVRGGKITTVLLKDISLEFGNIKAKKVDFGASENMRFTKDATTLVLEQLEPALFEIYKK